LFIYLLTFGELNRTNLDKGSAQERMIFIFSIIGYLDKTSVTFDKMKCTFF